MHRNVRPRTFFGPLVLTAAITVAAFVGCGGTSTESGSGETHFLMYCDEDSCGDGLTCHCGVCTKPCSGDDQCAALGARAECLPNVCAGESSACDVECTRSADCSSVGASFECVQGRCRERSPNEGDGGSGTGGSPGTGGATNGGSSGGPGADGGVRCPSGCTAVAAYSVTDCVNLPTDFTGDYVCECGTLFGVPSCHQRLSDGTAWYFAADALSEPEAWGPCTAEQERASLSACDYRDCAEPPISTCRPSDFCELVDCGGFDHFENGCARTDCQSDDDCAADERCTTNECGTSTGRCYYGQSGCECGFGPPVCLITHVCHPVAAVGPRGDWVSLTVDLGTGPCGEDDCSSTWTFTPDGDVAFEKRGTPGNATLDVASLGEVEAIVDGADLRAALRDGLSCGPPPTDIGVTVTLALEGETLSRDVTGCAISAQGNVFQRIYQMAQSL